MRKQRFGGRGCGPSGIIASVLLIQLMLAVPARGALVTEQQSELGSELKLPVTVWSDTSVRPRAIVVATHGLIMHGRTFDVMARQLAGQGFLVVAPDLRGFGRWMEGGPQHERTDAIDYKKSEHDLGALVVRLKADHPGLPLFCVGESLGASLSIRVAATRTGSVDGLVLASPAVKSRNLPMKRLVMDLRWLFTTPRHQVDLTPYIKGCASEDPQIVEAIMLDPLVRKHMSSLELLKSRSLAQSTLKYARAVAPTIPVLIIQGDADRVLKSNAVVLLLDQLRSKDETVRWFHQRGHVLLETAYIKPDTLDTVSTWLVQHTKTLSVQTASEDGGHGLDEN